MNTPSKVKIMHFVCGLKAGGVEQMLLNYCTEILKISDKYQFVIVFQHKPVDLTKNNFEIIGCKTIQITSKKKNFFKNLVDSYKIIQKENPNIVHSHMTLMNFFALFPAKIAGVKVRISHSHNAYMNKTILFKLFLYVCRNLCILFSTHLVACGKYAGISLFGQKRYDEGKVKIINNAIDLTKFKFNENTRNRVRHQLKVENKLVVGHIGRFSKQKNHEFLIKVFEKIHELKHNSVLVLVGVGELEEEIKNLVHQKKLDDCVKFLGKRNDCNELYQAMDVFVLPSNYEGLTVVGIEAQSIGLPCIFSTSVAEETKISPNVKFLSLEDSSEKWAKEAIELSKLGIAKDNTYASDHGYDIKKEAFKLVEFYDECIDEYKNQ